MLLAVLTASAVWQPVAFGQERLAAPPLVEATYVRVGGRGDRASDAVLSRPPVGVTPSRIAMMMFAHPAKPVSIMIGPRNGWRGHRIRMVTNEGHGRRQYGPSMSAAMKYLPTSLESRGRDDHASRRRADDIAFYQNAAENGPKACQRTGEKCRLRWDGLR